MTTPNTENGEEGVSNIVPAPVIKSNQAMESLIMTLALQRKEWRDLRSTNGIVLRMDSYRDPSNGRSYLLVAFGTDSDDVTGDDATGEIFINGKSVDDLLPDVVEKNKSGGGNYEENTSDSG